MVSLGLMFSVWHFLRKESKQRNESIGSSSSTSLTSPPPSPPSSLEPPPSLLLTTYSSDYIILLLPLPSPSANCLRKIRLITNQKKAHHQTAHTKTNQQLAKQKALEESKDWRLPFNFQTTALWPHAPKIISPASKSQDTHSQTPQKFNQHNPRSINISIKLSTELLESQYNALLTKVAFNFIEQLGAVPFIVT